MSCRMEIEMFEEAFEFAESVLADKQQLLDEVDAEQVPRADLCEARDALQVVLQQAQALRNMLDAHRPEHVQNSAAVKIEALQSKLRAARTSANRSNRKLKRMKRKLSHMERRYDRMCESMTYEERVRLEECVDLSSYAPPYTDIEMLSSDEWGEVADMPADSPHLWKYEGLE